LCGLTWNSPCDKSNSPNDGCRHFGQLIKDHVNSDARNFQQNNASLHGAAAFYDFDGQHPPKESAANGKSCLDE